MKFFRKYVDTISKRYLIIFLFVFIAVTIAINLLIPSLNYELAKPYLTRNIATLIDSSMVRQSIIWTSNRSVYSLRFDQEFQLMLNQYIAAHASSSQEIDGYIEAARSRVVFTWNESVSTSSQNMVIFDDGTVFGSDQAKSLAKSVISSQWYHAWDYQVDQFAYSPVIGSGGHDYLCFATNVAIADKNALIINAIDFAGILQQYHEIEALGIKDYVMVQGTETIYQNLESTRIDVESYPDTMFSTEQYEPMITDVYDGLDIMVLCSMPNENFRVAFHISQAELLRPYDNLLTIIQGLIYGLVLIILAIVYLITGNITKRIHRLDETMKDVGSGSYPQVTLDQRNDEISRLSQSFENMIKDLETSSEALLTQERRESQMQYALMVSAVDPHYIYNTLNTVSILAKMNRPEDVVKVNNALIATLKNRLQAKTLKPFDSVRIEKEALEQYIVIQNYLFADKIRLNFHVSDQNLNLLIPKNIIQPLVENSIKHGILPNKGPDGKPKVGEIHVTVFQNSNMETVISVIDNGVGMTDEALVEYQNLRKDVDYNSFDMEHIGIKNVFMRLIHIYGINVEFQIESEASQGTSFVIVLPEAPLKEYEQYA